MSFKPLFESEPCSRCGGSGRYSYNQIHGDRCYGCEGHGIALTKRGRAAQAYLDNICTIAVEAVQPGMRIKGHEATYTVEAIGVDHQTGRLKSVNGVESVLRHREFLSKSGKRYWESLSGTVRTVATEEQRQRALAYQATLTKAGTVRKNIQVIEEN